MQFQRAANPATAIDALISLVNDEAADRDGFVVTFESWDFICRAEALKVAGIVTLPALGDRFTDDLGAVYEVHPLPTGKHYRFVESLRVLLRIHTKLITAA